MIVTARVRPELPDGRQVDSRAVIHYYNRPSGDADGSPTGARAGQENPRPAIRGSSRLEPAVAHPEG